MYFTPKYTSIAYTFDSIHKSCLYNYFCGIQLKDATGYIEPLNFETLYTLLLLN